MIINQKPIKSMCDICGSQDHVFIFDGYDRIHNVEGDFKIIKCIGCGLFTLYPKISLEEMSKYYPKDFICFVPAIEDEEKFFVKLDRFRALRKRIKVIKRYSKRVGKILDIGCATGVLLNGLQQEGWDCIGVEPDQESANYAQTRFGLNVFAGYLQDTKFQSNYFDVITMIDVLEHVYNLNETLNEIYRILKPGGVFIAALPNAAAWERFIFGPYWIGWDIPRHYRTFNLRNIKTILEIHNFKGSSVFSYIGRHGAFMISLKTWLNDWNKPKWIKSIIAIVFGSLPMRLILMPFFWITEKLNRSTIMSFSAKK